MPYYGNSNNSKMSKDANIGIIMKNILEAEHLFEEYYGTPQKMYRWENGNLYEYTKDWSTIPNCLAINNNYQVNFSIFTPVSNLLFKIKNLFKRFNPIKPREAKYKDTQKEIHDYLVHDQHYSTDQADQICNDSMELYKSTKK